MERILALSHCNRANTVGGFSCRRGFSPELFWMKSIGAEAPPARAGNVSLGYRLGYRHARRPRPRHPHPTQLNTLARDLLESAFPLVWLEAELGNVTRPASGHLYFTLKDTRAQVKCAMFKPKSQC